MPYFLLLLILAFLPAQANAESQSLFDEPEVGELGPASQAALPRQQRFRGYNAYRSQFRIICTLLAEDGRLEAMHELFTRGLNDSSEDNCRHCIEFFRAFSRPCTPRPRFTRPGTDNTEPLRFREPNTKAIDAISRLFIALADDREVNTETAEALGILLNKIEQEEGTSAERDYFAILAAYMKAPFRRLLRQAGMEENEMLDQPVGEPGLGSLFDY